jgi:hypothetical protein
VKFAVVLSVLAACSFEHGEVPIPVDSPPIVDESPPGCMSFSSQLDTCAFERPTLDSMISGAASYNTDTGVLTSGESTVDMTHMTVQGNAGPMDAVFVRDVRFMANTKLRVTGSLPLAIIAYGTVTLEQATLIDATDGGAGARATCPNSAIAGRPDGGGAGGGGGGGFGGAGGTGGTGNSDGTAIAGGTGGEPIDQPPGPLGGCPGSAGGTGDDPGGAAGKGGGAIYIAAETKIEIAASAGINAGGGGGGGGHKDGTFSDGDAGGGGGGSGGMIMLESPVVRSMGTLAANGGGGGEASGNSSSGKGGEAGKLATTPAAGGGGNSSSGTDGGAGGAKGAPNGMPVTSSQAGGGGGGGGGAGFVVVLSADPTVATTSP